MPYVFDAAANKRKYLRIREKNKRKLNPCPGRPSHERQFIMRCMKQIGDAHAHWLDETDRAQELWLPPAHIDSRINEASSQMLPLWQDCAKDDDGYLLDTHNHNLKASNMITVGTWYRNEEQDLYAAFMPMLSPLPCDEWGALPLNLGHWRAAIGPMIEAHARLL